MITTKYDECELKLHELFCRLAGFNEAERRLSPFRVFRFRWQSWAEEYGDQSEARLEQLVDYLKLKNSRASERRYHVNVKNLYRILDDDAWRASMLLEAEQENRAREAMRRRPETPNRTEMLKATGRTEQLPDKVTTPEQIIGKRTVEELAQAMRAAL